MQKQPRVHAEPTKAHVEAARSYVVYQRANVGDIEGQRTNPVPLEVDACQARVTLGQREANTGVSWGILDLWSCQSVYPGFQPEYLLLSKEVLLPRFFSVG